MGLRQLRAPIKLLIAFVAFAIVGNFAAADDGPGADLLQWTELNPLPDSVGVAGPFAGVSNGALIVAGGANFPDGRPWDGHAKVWHDRVFVLDSPDGQWRVAPTSLPEAAAYGVSLTWNDTVVCIGGGNETTHFDACFLMRWNGADVSFESLPDLPIPAAFFCGAILNDVVYVMGGIEHPDSTTCLATAFALNLAAPASDRVWVDVGSWPGPERYLAIGGAQGDSIYLFGGIQLESDGDGRALRLKPFLNDAFRFTPTGTDDLHGRWSRVEDLPNPIAASPTPAMPIGSAHLMIPCGDDGTLGGGAMRDAHPGFDGAILSYHTITDSWTTLGNMPKDVGPDPAMKPEDGVWPTVTTVVVPWNDGFVIPTGEARPGVRTPRVLLATPSPPPATFGVINYAVVVVYLLSLIAMGVYFSRREETTGDFFLGGRRVPWWAAGISVFGTQLSAITFLAIPAKTYATDWVYFLQNMGVLLIAPVIVWMYIPFFRRLNLTTAYEYLEHRFNLLTRLIGAVSFVVFQLARMGIVLFLPALALAAVTGMDIVLCIVAMGILCTIYTALGGIEAVIWTDVVQVFVLLGGAILALGIMVFQVPDGAGGIIDVAMEHDKLKLANFEWDWTAPAIGVILLGAVFNNLVPYSSDQAVVQRYLTTADQRGAERAVWTGALLAVPASVIFFGVGTALFVYYQHHPERLNPVGPPDQIFAWFIVHEMPVGVAGVIVAGVFAAAMSSLDSSMNSIAAVVTTDFYRRFSPQQSEQRYLRFARLVTIVLGVAGTATAVLMAQVQVQSLWDEFLGYIGLLGGTMAGLFALGILSTRANARGAIIGAIAAVAMLAYVKTSTELNGLVYGAVGMTTCYIVGFIASLMFPGPPQSIGGLTIHTLQNDQQKGSTS